MKKTRIIRDICINLFASSLCTIVLNFLIYPKYARVFSAEEYGNILTIIGIINLLIAVLGNCLNNTRLVLNRNNSCNNENGNYNPIALIASTIGSIIVFLALLLFKNNSPITFGLIFLATLVGILRAYYIVSFRLRLDYFSQLISNIFVSAGYIFGMILMNKIQLWPLPIFLGESFSLVYITKKERLIKEPFCFTKDRHIIINTYFDLIITGLIGNVLAYFDRFLINPLLGATSVAIFSVAAFWGKIVLPFISPTANVMLSYLSQKDTDLSKKNFFILFAVSVVPLLFFGVIGFWFAPLIIKLFYPTLYEQAYSYIFLASMGSLIHSSTLLLMPVLLSICTSRKILKLQLIYFAIYLIIAYFGTKIGGLMGYCFGICIIGIIKIIIYLSFGFYNISKRR